MNANSHIKRTGTRAKSFANLTPTSHVQPQGTLAGNYDKFMKNHPHGSSKDKKIRSKSTQPNYYTCTSNNCKNVKIHSPPVLIQSDLDKTEKILVKKDANLQRQGLLLDDPLVFIRPAVKSNIYRDWIMSKKNKLDQNIGTTNCTTTTKPVKSKRSQSLGNNRLGSYAASSISGGEKLAINICQKNKSLSDILGWSANSPGPPGSASDGQNTGETSKNKLNAMVNSLNALSSKASEDILKYEMKKSRNSGCFDENFIDFCSRIVDILGLKGQIKFIPQVDFKALWILFKFFNTQNQKTLAGNANNCAETSDPSPTATAHTGVGEPPMSARSSRSRNRRSVMSPKKEIGDQNLTTEQLLGQNLLLKILSQSESQHGGLSPRSKTLLQNKENPILFFLLTYGLFLKTRSELFGRILAKSFFNLPIQIFYQKFLENCSGGDSHVNCDENNNLSSPTTSMTTLLEISRAKKSQSEHHRQLTSVMKLSKPKTTAKESLTPRIPKSSQIFEKRICLEGCRYDVVRRIAFECGYHEVCENEVWNILWTDTPLTQDKCIALARNHQVSQLMYFRQGCPIPKTNHFPGMSEICRKDRLAFNLNRMRKRYPKDYKFFPKTWILPEGLPALSEYWAEQEGRATFILKPDSGSQGKGIFLVKNLKKLNPFSKLICQVYIKPYLIDELKFDLRIFTLITCVDPLRIFIYNEGIARFATVKYAQPTEQNIDIVYMHLTNYSLNKFSENFRTQGEGSKRKMSKVFKYLEEKGEDIFKLQNAIDELVVKTMISALPTLRNYYQGAFPRGPRGHDLPYKGGCACFEILGFDILVDHKLKPYLLEVNHSPSFNLDLEVDAEIKEALLSDTFKIIYLGKISPPSVLSLVSSLGSSKSQYDICCGAPAPDQIRPNSRSSRSSSAHPTQRRNSSINLKAVQNSQKLTLILAQFEHELQNLGNFRLVYTQTEEFAKYNEFFDQHTPLPGQTGLNHLVEKLNGSCISTKSRSTMWTAQVKRSSSNYQNFGQFSSNNSRSKCAGLNSRNSNQNFVENCDKSRNTKVIFSHKKAFKSSSNSDSEEFAEVKSKDRSNKFVKNPYNTTTTSKCPVHQEIYKKIVKTGGKYTRKSQSHTQSGAPYLTSSTGQFDHTESVKKTCGKCLKNYSKVDEMSNSEQIFRSTTSCTSNNSRSYSYPETRMVTVKNGQIVKNGQLVQNVQIVQPGGGVEKNKKQLIGPYQMKLHQNLNYPVNRKRSNISETPKPVWK